MRVARLGREICSGLENPGADWVKLEVLGDKKTLLPDPIATLEATERLVAEGFQVLCYTTDDPIIARRLKEAGATSVMPAGSPIGSGQGILNPNNIRICLEYLKEGDPDYPVIVDAGVGTASDVTIAMELGVDGVLLEHRHRPRRRPAGHGPRDEGRDRRRPPGLSLRPHPEKALRHGQQPGDRHHRSAALHQERASGLDAFELSTVGSLIGHVRGTAISRYCMEIEYDLTREDLIDGHWLLVSHPEYRRTRRKGIVAFAISLVVLGVALVAFGAASDNGTLGQLGFASVVGALVVLGTMPFVPRREQRGFVRLLDSQPELQKAYCRHWATVDAQSFTVRDALATHTMPWTAIEEVVAADRLIVFITSANVSHLIPPRLRQ